VTPTLISRTKRARSRPKCDCPIHCKYCGAQLRIDQVGHYCPTKNCQWSQTGSGLNCTMRQPE